jgi:hypothetical protein
MSGAAPGTDITIVNDPTGSGKGKVLSLHFKRLATESPGQQVDRNRHIDYYRKTGLGQSIFFRGEVYFDTPSLDPGGGRFIMRKLLYWQPYGDGGKYGGNGSVQMFDVMVMFNHGIQVQTGYIANGTLYYGGGPARTEPIQGRRWHTVEKQLTMNSTLDSADGIMRLWIDGDLVIDKTDMRYTDSDMIRRGVPNGNGTLMEIQDVAFNSFAVGDQMQCDFEFDEYRYWDNVQFSTKRIGF